VDGALAPNIHFRSSGYEDREFLYLCSVLLQLHLEHGFEVAAEVLGGDGAVLDLYLVSDLREGAPSEVLQLTATKATVLAPKLGVFLSKWFGGRLWGKRSLRRYWNDF